MKQHQHYQLLDGLRGVAAFSVVLHHLGHAASLNLSHNGYLAVDFFLLLSGFVISLAYENKLKIELRFRDFLTIRVKRLYPTIFIGFLLGFFAFEFVGKSPSFGFVISEFFLIPQIGSKSLYPMNDPMWSILFEIFANIVHAAIVFRIGVALLAAAVGVVGIILLGALIAKPQSGLSAWSAAGGLGMLGAAARIAFSYGLGIIIFRLVSSGKLKPIKSHWSVPTILLIAALNAPPIILPSIFDGLMIVFVFPLIVLIALGTQISGFAKGVALWLGAISYPLYAVHMPLVLIGKFLNPGAHYAVWVAVAVASIVVATIVEYLWDAPLRSFFRRQVRDRGRKEGSPPVPSSLPPR